jgi:hypothetical protein
LVKRDTHNRERKKSSGQAILFNTVFEQYEPQNLGLTSGGPEFVAL